MPCAAGPRLRPPHRRCDAAEASCLPACWLVRLVRNPTDSSYVSHALSGDEETTDNLCSNLRRNGIRASRDDVSCSSDAPAAIERGASEPDQASTLLSELEVRCRCLPWEDMTEATARGIAADVVLGADITCVCSPGPGPLAMGDAFH